MAENDIKYMQYIFSSLITISVHHKSLQSKREIIKLY